MAVLAITGGTGFVGGHLLDLAIRKGHKVRALTRRVQPHRAGLTWIRGDLSDDAALSGLCCGADAVIHVAGVVNAKDERGFHAGNVAGTAAMLSAAAGCNLRRFVHVSSLSAREPDLSLYGASKAEAEALVRQSAFDWVIVQPPAVFGPGDTEMVDLYRLAAHGLALLPGRGRFSMIYVADLAAALLALALSDKGSRQTFEIAGPPAALSHGEVAEMIGAALGRRVRKLRLPTSALKLGAGIDTLRSRISGRLPKLSRDRARYIAHPDWIADPAALMALGIWTPETPVADGIRRTADWYRAEGVL